MNNKSLIVFCAFLLSIGLGMLDRETESLLHLLTAEPGNIVAILLYTLIFSLLGLGIYKLYQMVKPKES